MAHPLDAHYSLTDQELEFFQTQTGISDEKLLKEHIMKVQADAYKIFPYGCIRLFVFTKLKIAILPAYSQLLKLGQERQGAIFLDIGCCVGSDTRKAVADGFPVENIVASDIQAGFWPLGHQLFKTTPEQFPAHFVPGDALDQEFLKTAPPFYSPPEAPVPALSSLTTLTPLLGHVSAIHASLFFHLFDEPQQLQLARSLAGLLSPQPGSLIFGVHGARDVKGYRMDVPLRNNGTYTFCHSPETWTELWDGVVFKKGTVKVETSLVEIDGKDYGVNEGATFYILMWSVTRL